MANIRSRHLVPGTIAAAAFIPGTFTEVMVDSLFVAGSVNGTKLKSGTVPQTSWDSDALARSADLFMDQSTPSTTAGRGVVVGTGNQGLIEAQAVPALTVRIQAGNTAETYNNLGVRNVVDATAQINITGFTIPAGGGDGRIDVVVVNAAGTPVRRVGAEAAVPVAPALVAGDVPLASVLLTQGVDVDIQVGNITDLRSRTAISQGKIGLTSGQILIGTAGGAAQGRTLSNDIVVSTTGVAFITTAMILPAFALGPWAVDGDGVYTNGGGLVGDTPNLIASSYAKVYDEGTLTFADLSASATLGDWTANWQLLPDLAADQIGDAFYLGNDIKFCEVGFELTALAIWAAGLTVYEYWNGAAWAALTITGAGGEGYDNTNDAVHDGTKTLVQVGAIVFAPPADWASTIVDGQAAFWIRCRLTATGTTQPPVVNGANPARVIGEGSWVPPHICTLDSIVVNNNSTTLHGANVVFLAYNSATGEHRKFVWTAGRRKQRISATAWALLTSDRIHWFVIREAGANEPSGVSLDMELRYTSL